MGKISGWKKMRYGNKLGGWIYEPYKSYGWDVPKGTVQIDILKRLKGKNKGLYSVQIWFAKNGKGKVIESKFFTNRDDVKKFAVNWMREHPNG